MRSLFILLFIFLLSFNALGAVIYHIDFSNDPKQIIKIMNRDMVEFRFPLREYNNESEFLFVEKDERVMVNNINNDKGLVDLTVFIEGAETPFYASIDKERVLNVDFERDGVDDLRVGLYGIQGDNVTLIFEKILEKDKPKDGKLPGENVENKNVDGNKKEVFSFVSLLLMYKYFIFVGILIILVLVIFRKNVVKGYRKIKRRV